MILTDTNPSIDLFLCYRGPGLTLSQFQWSEVVQNIDINKHSILMGDFNSYNVTWNCTDTDKNGIRFDNAAKARGLFMYNFNLPLT